MAGLARGPNSLKDRVLTNCKVKERLRRAFLLTVKKSGNSQPASPDVTRHAEDQRKVASYKLQGRIS